MARLRLLLWDDRLIPKGHRRVTDTEIKNLTFEQAFSELEESVREMEAGNLALDQAMVLFERGVALAAYCNELLDTVELRVRQLVPSQGEPVATDEYEVVNFEERPPAEDAQ
jgi:exodeoxyribonuclease VII small subunit